MNNNYSYSKFMKYKIIITINIITNKKKKLRLLTVVIPKWNDSNYSSN